VQRMLDLVPTDIHERCPVILGGARDVKLVLERYGAGSYDLAVPKDGTVRGAAVVMMRAVVVVLAGLVPSAALLLPSPALLPSRSACPRRRPPPAPRRSP